MTKSKKSSKLLAMLLAFIMVFTVVQSAALADFDADTAAADDVIAAQIDLTTGASFQVKIPVSAEQAEVLTGSEDDIVWSLMRDSDKVYVSKTLFPNQVEGGPLDTWEAQNGEALFQNVQTSVEEENGQNYLAVSFDTICYFWGADWWSGETYEDPSAPHDEGGVYLDVCGYFDLCAELDGEEIGSAPVKVVPYDSFHTMAEIYEEIDNMVDFAAENTDLYVQKFSMGTSSGVLYDALDMPYLIVAKDAQAVADWLALTELAETEPEAVLADIEAGAYDDICVPVMFSNVHSNEVAASDGIIDFAWTLLNAAADDGKLSYNTFTGFTAAGEAQLADEMGEVGGEGSLAIPDLIKDNATYLGYLQDGNGQSGVVDMDAYYEQAIVDVDIDELLSDVFFIIVPEENVEGRTNVTREATNGYDLNRDNSFQTTPETANMQKLIGTFNPVSFTEFHGRVEGFQVEPCDPPHEPNFEYDLLAEHLVTGGEALGIAAVANNASFNSYVMPQRDYLIYTGEVNEDGSFETYWSDPWDDMSTSYTPQFSMLQGTVAYTVELPAYNDDSVKLVSFGILGQSNYVASEKLSYLTAQTKIYQRGVNNFNSDAFELVGQWFCDQYDVEGAEADLFRPEFTGDGENGNFFPECYIIPMDGENQTNLQAAYDMLVWLSRNDVKVIITEDEFTYEGVTYPAGTAIISMYQAKRSVANGALYDGTLIQGWTILYSEGITSFAATRGFDMVTVTEPAAYETISAAFGNWMDYEDCLAYVAELTSYFTGVEDECVILSNASTDAIAAVNELLKSGKGVGMVTDEDSEFYGDFVMNYENWLSVASKYVLSGTGLAFEDQPAAKIITKSPTVYIAGSEECLRPASEGFVYGNQVNWNVGNWNYDRVAMDVMGFTTTADVAEADLIAGCSALTGEAEEAAFSGKPYIGYGADAAASVGIDYATWSYVYNPAPIMQKVGGAYTVLDGAMDCLAYVEYPEENLINASYAEDADDMMYGYGLGFFSAIPEGAAALVAVDGSKDPTEGFVPTYTADMAEAYEEFLNGGILGFSYKDDELNFALFANSLTHKGHQTDEYAYISNFAFSNVLGDSFTAFPFADVDPESFAADAILWAVNEGITTGTSATTFKPDKEVTRAQVVTFLYRAAGCPDVEGTMPFTDVDPNSSYADAILWAVNEGITIGTTETTFAPDKTCTRGQIVTFLARYAGVEEAEGPVVTKFVDVDPDSYCAYAVEWAVNEGITTGTSATTFKPDKECTRAQVVTFLYRLCTNAD